MQHIHDLGSIHLDGCGLTIGSFDGVHLGHQSLVLSMVTHANTAGLPSVVLTFYPHPSAVLRGRRPTFYINSPEEKAILLGDLGVDYVITQRFDHKLSQVSADAFLDMLQIHTGFSHFWVGEDFALGHEREGDHHFLETASANRKFQLHFVPPILLGEEVVSSTRIRQALRAGDVASVATYLGRTFTILGEVVAGSNRGKRLGFPTANLRVLEERAYPRSGVYACIAEVVGRHWPAVTNIGVRPTFEETQGVDTIETHLLDFNHDLYRQEMRLAFIDRLRDEQRFSSPEALIAQIQTDIRRAREILDPLMEMENA